MLTTRELAKILGVHEQTIRGYVRQGMPCLKLNKSNFRFELEKCLNWFEERGK